MRILTLNYEYPPIGGGAAPVAKDIAEALVARGHEVTVVTMGYGNLPAHEIIEGVEIFRLKCLRSKEAVCYPWEQLTYIIAAKKFLKKHLETSQYDINHTHFIIPTGVIAKWIKKHYNIPYVIMSHGSDVPGYNQKRFKLMHKFLRKPWKNILNNAKALHVPSQFLKDLIMKSKPDQQCLVTPHGIDLDKYRKEPKENIILTMSRLQPHKGIQFVIAAFAEIVNELDERWELHIAGDGPYRSALEELVAKNNLQDSVVFHGWLESKSREHIDLLAKSKIFVSASSVESFGVSVAEAIASDCRVILSDIEAHRYFEEYCSGYFELGDADTLVGCLKEAMMNPDTVLADKKKLSLEYSINMIEEILMVSRNS